MHISSTHEQIRREVRWDVETDYHPVITRPLWGEDGEIRPCILHAEFAKHDDGPWWVQKATVSGPSGYSAPHFESTSIVSQAIYTRPNQGLSERFEEHAPEWAREVVTAELFRLNSGSDMVV